MPPRLDERTKALHGTQHRRPAPVSVGTPRLDRVIPPPRDLAPELKLHWQRHMVAALASGRMAAAADLLAFAEMVKAAHLAEVGYAEALREGPTVTTETGRKGGPAWRAYVAAAGHYRTWLTRFGLEPKGRGAVKQLPGLSGGLHLVSEADDS